MKTVTVVVPIFNGRDLVADCLNSIPGHAEVIAVDDGSTDGAPELIESTFPSVSLLRNERNLGFGGAANRGLRAATGEVRIVLNSDARFMPGALDRLVAAFDDDGVGVAGARRRFPDGSHQTSAARFPTPGSIITGSFLLNEIASRLAPTRRFPWELGLSRRAHETSADVDWVSGTCIAIRDRCFTATGGFDESYYLYVEETDLCLRAWRAGWRVRYVADAEVTHLGGGSTGDPLLHAQRMIRSEARFMTRAYGEQVLPRWKRARLVSSVIKVAAFAPLSLVDRRARTRLRWHRAAFGATRAYPLRATS